MPSLLVLASNNSISYTHREDRLGIFNIVNFPNLPCTGSNGLNGTCLSTSECVESGGQVQGTCARNFGVCCYYSISTCGSNVEVTKNQTYITNPGFSSPYTVSSDTTCSYRFIRLNSDICQVRLDFETFDLGPPYYTGITKYECTSGQTDYVTFTPAGAKTNGLLLCGYNTGQHLYLDMGTSSASPSYATMTMALDATNWSTYNRKWRIMVSQIPCNCNFNAPVGCDQYMFGNGGTGVIQSFNYDQPTNIYRAKLAGYYTTCIRKEAGQCKIGYTPPSYSDDPLGLSISGGAPVVSGRMSCSNPRPTPGAGTCNTDFIQIPQGTKDGKAPFVNTSPLSKTGCDRFCGKRLCAIHGQCENGEPITIYSEKKPFQIHVEFASHSVRTDRYLKGYKLNYFQTTC